MRAYLRISLLSCVLSVFFGSSIVVGHQIGGSKFNPPIPLSFLFLGGGATIALTSMWLHLNNIEFIDRDENRPLTIPKKVGDWVVIFGRYLFFIFFIWTLYTGVFGEQVRIENFATIFVWPIWLKGIGLFSVLFGSPWQVLSPWRNLYKTLKYIEGREISIFGDYPKFLGEWPALFGFIVLVGFIENLTLIPRSPRSTVVVVSIYSIVMVLGGVFFGEKWFRKADFLEVLYRLFGRVAPINIQKSNSGHYNVLFRPPWNGCIYQAKSLSITLFIIAVLYTVSFDGFTSTPEYQTIIYGLNTIVGLRFIDWIFYFVGYFLFIFVFLFVTFISEKKTKKNIDFSSIYIYAPTLLPIAVVYEIAHYYPWILQNIGDLLSILVGYIIIQSIEITLLGWFSPLIFWSSQLLLIVGGHLIAVTASHYTSIKYYKDKALKPHIPLTVLMIIYTILSLWIISRPIVN